MPSVHICYSIYKMLSEFEYTLFADLSMTHLVPLQKLLLFILEQPW